MEMFTWLQWIINLAWILLFVFIIIRDIRFTEKHPDIKGGLMMIMIWVYLPLFITGLGVFKFIFWNIPWFIQ